MSLVNITPSSFSVVYASPGSSDADVSVFADPAGTTNLTRQLGVELYPLHTGNPFLTGSYDRRLDQAVLRQKTSNRGLVHVRVSRCQPGKTYYYRLRAVNAEGQEETWPRPPALAQATTAAENSFVLQSRQLVFNLPGLDPSGAIVLLSNSNTPSLLAATAGDGVASNQVYFSVSDMIAATGATNFLPLGTQEFTATVLEASSNAVAQKYALTFTTDFLVSQTSLVDLGSYAVLGIGSAVHRTGEAGRLPITLNASSITNVAFLLEIPASRFAALTLLSSAPSLASASLTALSPNTFRLALAALPGQDLQGNRQIAELSFVTASNLPSTFVPFAPQGLQVLNFDGAPVDNLAVRAGRLVIVGNEPLLEALRAPDGERQLALYGKPWASYAIEYATRIANPVWTHLLRFPMTNLVQVFPGLDHNPDVIFYRAYEFAADPPLLEAKLAGANRSLLVYGRAGTNYSLHYSTNLSGVATWYPRMNFTLTNSFEHVAVPGNGEPMIFYRLQRP